MPSLRPAHGANTGIDQRVEITRAPDDFAARPLSFHRARGGDGWLRRRLDLAAVSSMTTMQRRLWESGVDAELFLFDGLGHAFMMDPALPESRETYAILVRFFDRHLGR